MPRRSGFATHSQELRSTAPRLAAGPRPWPPPGGSSHLPIWLSTALDALAGHQPSHRDLVPRASLSATVSTTAGLLDAVVVPTSRPFAETEVGLRVAATVAGWFRCRLLVLCSGDAVPAQFPFRCLGPGSGPVAVLDLSEVRTSDLPLPTFETRSHRFGAQAGLAQRDVADKRNLALLLASVFNWRSVLFLDDDVRFPPGNALADHFGRDSVARALTELHLNLRDAAGWVMTDYPDNSSVCHARRLLGEPQEQFIGGGSLAVAVGHRLPFFPSIYNEDWLFLYPYLRRRRSQSGRVVEAGPIGQARYEPFTVERALHQEIGDLLAEGMFGVLGSGLTEDVIWHPEYWIRVIRSRRQMIEGMLPAVESRSEGDPTSDDLRRAAASLDCARSVYAGYTQEGGEAALAAELVEYLVKWGKDTQRWQRHLRHATPATAGRFLKAVAPCSVLTGCNGILGFLEGSSSRLVADRALQRLSVC